MTFNMYEEDAELARQGFLPDRAGLAGMGCGCQDQPPGMAGLGAAYWGQRTPAGSAFGSGISAALQRVQLAASSLWGRLPFFGRPGMRGWGMGAVPGEDTAALPSGGTVVLGFNDQARAVPGGAGAWIPVSRNAAGQWVDASGNTAPGVPNQSPGATSTDVLGAVSDVTNYVARDPLLGPLAVMSATAGLQHAIPGAQVAQRQAPPAPAPSGPGVGTVLGIGALIVGAAVVAEKYGKASEAAQTTAKAG